MPRLRIAREWLLLGGTALALGLFLFVFCLWMGNAFSALWSLALILVGWYGLSLGRIYYDDDDAL